MSGFDGSIKKGYTTSLRHRQKRHASVRSPTWQILTAENKQAAIRHGGTTISTICLQECREPFGSGHDPGRQGCKSAQRGALQRRQGPATRLQSCEKFRALKGARNLSAQYKIYVLYEAASSRQGSSCFVCFHSKAAQENKKVMHKFGSHHSLQNTNMESFLSVKWKLHRTLWP